MILNWGILQDGKCPKCAAKLHMGLLDTHYSCSEEKCDFVIGREKFEMIAYGGMHPSEHHVISKKGYRDRDEERMSELNNMGRDEITEGFEDSPFRV